MVKASGARPFRLYNPTTKKFLPWRCYKIKRNAHIGAMCECRWAAVGHAIQIIDKGSPSQKMIGEYRRLMSGVKIPEDSSS